MPDSDPPQIKNHPGRWDEVVTVAILLTPFLLTAAAATFGLVILVTGQLRFDATIVGTIPATLIFNRVGVPLTYLFIVMFVGVYILSVMKFFGARPFAWLLRRAHNLAQNYNPPTDED